MSESGLTRVGAVVIVTGPALQLVLNCAAIAVKQRKMSGLPFSTTPYESLVCELRDAMAADGHSVIRSGAVRDPVPVDEQPTVPLAEAAALLHISDRQARRRARQLGGRKIAGRWFVDELALGQHLEGRQA